MSKYRSKAESAALRELIIAMVKDFPTQKEIAQRLRISQRYVSRVLNQSGVKCKGIPRNIDGRALFDKDGCVILPELSEEEKAECRASVFARLTRSVNSDNHVVNRGR